jgi:large subunit ribosomal protein L24e
MKIEIDSFSGNKIYPGRGRLFVRSDSKVFRFVSSKSESLFKQRKNPRRISWTVLYRRQHKKGVTEEVAKKRTRRAVKHQRAIVGASLDVIKEKRSMRPEARQAARAQAIKNAKDKKKEAETKKRADKASAPRAQSKVFSKQQAKGAPSKVHATSR